MIKESIVESPALRSPYFDKEFILYTFTSDTSCATILTQKKEEGDEVSISFMSSSLQGAELKYPDIENHGIEVVKVVKHFRPYSVKD